ncbi:MAG: hypothetical protein ACTSRF_16160 [Candidatus Freyarchaeota archaeon]
MVEAGSEDDVRKYLTPLRGFDRSAEASPIEVLVAEKGVRKAYEELLKRQVSIRVFY